MTAATITPVQAVTRYWKTGLIITQTGVTGAAPDLAMPDNGELCQVLPPGTIPGMDALRDQFLISMNALAAADQAREVTGCEITVLAWHEGYDQPSFSCQARYAGWTVLAASPTPVHVESGCLAFSDPKAGSAGTAMPGLPWGRQFIIHPVPGAHAVVPGWLTCSVVPLEQGQHVIVAAALSVP